MRTTAPDRLPQLTKLIHVAAAAIFNSEGKLLLALRDKKQHQGGLWEFPGGKVEEGEDIRTALARELHEELGIDIEQAATRPLIQVPYHYPDKSVLLDVFRVDSFSGEAWGKEGQPLEWVEPQKLPCYPFPAANKPIVNSLLLPRAIAITPELRPEQYADYIRQLGHQADGVMLRAKHLSDAGQSALFEELRIGLEKQGRPLFWNSSVELANRAGAEAVHLSSARLQQLGHRDEFKGRWLGASCHNRDEINLAIEKGVDYITLSPVQRTASHPETVPLGWQCFSELVAECPVPVFALGGISVADQAKVIESGAQGFAGISGFI